MSDGSARRGGLAGGLLLAALPTPIVRGIVSLVETLRRERIVFASLASGPFPIHARRGDAADVALLALALLAALVALGRSATWAVRQRAVHVGKARSTAR